MTQQPPQRTSQSAFRGMYRIRDLAKTCGMPVPTMRAFLKQYTGPYVWEGDLMLLRSDELRALKEAVRIANQRAVTPPAKRQAPTPKQTRRTKPSRRGGKTKPEPDDPGPHVG
jgi:hypothetical protein